jgi:hypothetical protein
MKNGIQTGINRDEEKAMIQKKSLLLLLFTLCGCSIYSRAQLWSGILDPSRATNWTQTGIPGGIPNYTTICQTVAPSGLTDATDKNAINAAIGACGNSGSGKVVKLQAGTYTITAGLLFNRNDFGNFSTPYNQVVLRGAGPDQTILKFTGTEPCAGNISDICIIGTNQNAGAYPGQALWTGDNGTAGSYAPGDTLINVGAWTGTIPAVGDTIILDQRNDSIGICPASGGTDLCAGVSGATESGTTVTITTSQPHGFSVNDCVGIGEVGVAGYNALNNMGLSCGSKTGWFTVTAVPSSTTFQYTASTSGLAASGSGYVTKDTGGVFITDVYGATISESNNAVIGRRCPTGNAFGTGGNIECAAGEISVRSQALHRTITSCNGSSTPGASCSGATTLTIDPPLELTNWRTSQNPGVWWLGRSITQDGVEDLTLDMAADGTSHNGISFVNAYKCWVRNVRGVNGARNHVAGVHSSRLNIENNYFYGTKGGATQSYGIEMLSDASDLIQNNICQHVVACIVNGQDYGSVFSYNYGFDDGVNGTTWLMALLSGDHDVAGNDLFEGNDSNVLNQDDTHGTGTTITAFRNRLSGQGVPYKTNNASWRAYTTTAFMRANNIVGNILGTVGSQTNYQTTTNFGPAVYGMNFNNVTTNDPLLLGTQLRWGNYDTASAAVRWCGNSSSPGWSTTCASASEIPTTGVPFLNGNPVPASTSLPASFYLSARPAFWTTPFGTPPWPAIGPDITASGTLDTTCSGNPNACDGVNHMSYQIPAQMCYLNTAVDPAYQQTFTATGASWSSGTATLTIGTNSLATPETVTVSGISPAAYNGIFQITSSSSTTISYALPTNPGTYSSGGTVTWPNIRLFNAAKCYPDASGGTLNPPNPPTNLNAVAQ